MKEDQGENRGFSFQWHALTHRTIDGLIVAKKFQKKINTIIISWVGRSEETDV